MGRPSLTVAALTAVLLGCDAVPEVDSEAERATFNMVTGAAVDRDGEDIDVSWPAYLAADERLTEAERERFARFIASWEQRVAAGERR